MEPRPKSFYYLSAFFVLFLVFLYGPTLTIGIPGSSEQRRIEYDVSLYYVNNKKQTCRLDR